MGLSWREEAKRAAAFKAVQELVEDGMVVGLGSGSTMAYAIQALAERVRSEELDILCIPTSYQVFFLAVRNGLRITSLDEHPEPDLALDGADQVDKDLNLIKGGGAAMTREKIVDYASKRLAIIVDEAKLAERLGEKGLPVPLEVLPFSPKNPPDSEELGRKLLELIGLMRVFTKPVRGEPAEKALVVRRGATVIEVAEMIHKSLAKGFKYAKVWSDRLPYSPMRVGREFRLEDCDIVEIHA